MKVIRLQKRGNKSYVPSESWKKAGALKLPPPSQTVKQLPGTSLLIPISAFKKANVESSAIV